MISPAQCSAHFHEARLFPRLSKIEITLRKQEIDRGDALHKAALISIGDHVKISVAGKMLYIHPSYCDQIMDKFQITSDCFKKVNTIIRTLEFFATITYCHKKKEELAGLQYAN